MSPKPELQSHKSFESLEIQGTTDRLDAVIEAFLIDRRVQNVRPGTLHFYRWKLSLLLNYCNAQQVKVISQIDTTFLRTFFLWLAESHNPGGCHAVYRSVKTLLNWYADEVDGYSNPMRRIKAPRLDLQPLDPVSLDVMADLLRVAGARDRALILFLLDTGVRAAELLSLHLADVNLLTGEVLIRRGKGGKPRTVYIGKKTRRAIRAFIRSGQAHLFESRYHEQLTYDGLRAIIIRLAQQAKVDTPTLHSFRRAFALNSLRNGCDVFTLQRLMGHADLQVLHRYLALTERDVRGVPSVVDQM